MKTLDLPADFPAAMTVGQFIYSPQLPTYVQTLQALLQREHERRERFYAEMLPEHKVEFINGEVIVHSPVRLRHNIVSQNVLLRLSAYVRDHQLGYVGYEKLLVALTRNDYEPDIVYFGPAKAQTFTLDQVKFPAPDLAAEVLSPSTEDIDRRIKFQDYAAHGVLEYWIIDPDQKCVEQYGLRGASYELLMKSQTGMLKSLAVPGFELEVGAVFEGL